MGDPYKFDVIIIGAGISGIIAACTLIEKEPALDIKILEAKDRIGGRTLSVPIQGSRQFKFDIGAQWVSSSQINLMNLINDLNLTLVPQFRTGLALGICNRCIQPYTDHPLLGNYFSQLEVKDFFGKLEQRSKDNRLQFPISSFEFDFYDCVTMEHYIRAKLYTRSARNVAMNLIRITCGVRAAQISVWDYLAFCNSTLGLTNQYMTHDRGAKQFWIQESASAICHRLKERLGDSVFVASDPVIEINYTQEDEVVTLTASGKKYKSYFLISAIPPQEILRIKFNPPFNKIRQSALEQVQTGHVTKFIITYKSAFWRRQGFSGEIIDCDDGPINVCYDASKDDNAALTGYINEPSAINNQGNSYREKVIKQLVRYYGEEARCPIDYVEKNWWDEPYVGGCPISCPGVGTTIWYHTLRRPLGRIYWAGTETATEWTGYMEGAIQAGRRAAIDVIYRMRPQTLSSSDFIIESHGPHVVRLSPVQIFNKYTMAAVFLGGYFILRLLRQ